MTSDDNADELRLVSSPGEWDISIETGFQVHVRAHAYAETGDDIVFVLLMEGTPCFELEVARFPRSSVVDIEGG